jgi:hypothetical protein
MVAISLGVNNEQTLYDKDILNTLFPLMQSPENTVWRKAVTLLRNISAIQSVEAKNAVIEKDIFNILHKKLLEISPEPLRKMDLGDYYCIYTIIIIVNNLLISNPSGVELFLDSPLIPFLNCILDSSISLLDTSSDENLQGIFKDICSLYVKCSKPPFEKISRFIKLNGADTMLSVIEKFVTQIKEDKKRLKEKVVENALITIFNIALHGSTKSKKGKENLAREAFEENNKFNRLVDVCKFLISQQQSSQEQKRITDRISLAVCRLLKSERPAPSFGCILAYVDNLKSSPPHPDGYSVSSTAQNAWKNMVGADDCLSSFKK